MKPYIILFLLTATQLFPHQGHDHEHPEQKHLKVEKTELHQFTSFLDSIDDTSKFLEKKVRQSFSIPDEEALERYKYFVDCGAFRQRKVDGEYEIYISARFGLAKSKQPSKPTDNTRASHDIYGTSYVATLSLRAGRLTISEQKK